MTRIASTPQARHAEERLRLFVDALDETSAVYLLDVQGRILVGNAGAHRLHGYSADDVGGSHVGCLYTMEDADAGKPSVDLRLAEYDGEFREEAGIVLIVRGVL